MTKNLDNVVVIRLSTELLKEIDNYIKDTELNRSQLIRIAIKKQLKEI